MMSVCTSVPDTHTHMHGFRLYTLTHSVSSSSCARYSILVYREYRYSKSHRVWLCSEIQLTSFYIYIYTHISCICACYYVDIPSLYIYAADMLRKRFMFGFTCASRAFVSSTQSWMNQTKQQEKTHKSNKVEKSTKAGRSLHAIY